jgi:hypothetical protein
MVCFDREEEELTLIQQKFMSDVFNAINEHFGTYNIMTQVDFNDICDSFTEFPKEMTNG